MNPYRVLFSIGFLYALGGLSLWVIFPSGLIPYPAFLHADWMMQGFLLSFAMGFLMTALPKFLNSAPCRLWELNIAIGCTMLPLMRSVFPPLTQWHTEIVPFLWLGFYAASRFRKAEFQPPPSFIFIPLGLLSGILGIFSKPLIIEGALLSFILGIGSKLIPALLGHSKPILIQLSSQKRSFTERLIFVEAGLFLIGIVFHIAEATSFGDFCWAVVVTSMAIRFWKILSRPKMHGYLSLLLWASSWMVVVGLWLVVFFSAYRVHMMHGIYVGGMSLMALCVATRVVLAHGGFALTPEISSKGFLLCGTLCIIAAMTRMAAAFLPPESYFLHLAYASSSLALGFIFWAVAIGYKLVLKPPATEPEEENCK